MSIYTAHTARWEPLRRLIDRVADMKQIPRRFVSFVLAMLDPEPTPAAACKLQDGGFFVVGIIMIRRQHFNPRDSAFSTREISLR